MPKRNPPIQIDRSTEDAFGWKDNQTMQHMLYQLGAAGMDNREIANLLGVRLKTLQRAVAFTPELHESLVEGRDHATQTMVAQLYNTAIGGKVVQEIKETINPKGEKTTTIVTKELPPNPTLMIFWLVNRDGNSWRHIRQMIVEAKKNLNDGDSAEADKIARLAGSLLEHYPELGSGQHSVSQDASRDAGQDTGDAGDVQGDVPGQTADCVQDDAVDVSAETRTERP